MFDATHIHIDWQPSIHTGFKESSVGESEASRNRVGNGNDYLWVQLALGYRRKYQLLSTNVSIVSVSLRPGLPQAGQVVVRHSCIDSRGEVPFPVKGTSLVGNNTGSSESGTGRLPNCR